MRAPTDNTYVNRSNVVDSQRTKMKFHEESVEFLMDVMTNLYEDEELAVIREYPSNALDSHLASGQTRPVEVTLPTMFNKVFRVQDWGLGMSVDDVHNVYSQYGYSTKRDNDVEVGMLGLGSKAGLALTDQFTVDSVKDGVRIIATVARGDDGVGEIDTIDTHTTNAPNGVTITIPVRSVEYFNRKARDFFRWWEPGTVLVDGQEPEGPQGDTLEITDDITLFKSGLDRDYVVMGCIAYPVGDRLSNGLPYGFHVVAYVPMGAVSIPPAREGLRYTRKTEAVIEDINNRREAGIRAAAEKDIKQAKSHTDALRASVTWKRLLSGSPEYLGKPIPTAIVAPHLPDSRQPAYGNGKVHDTFFLYDTVAYRSSVHTANRIEVERFLKSVIVTDFTNKDISSPNRRKIKEWMRQQDLSERFVILHGGLIGGEWADDITTVSWEEIKKVKLTSSNTGRKTGLAGKVNIFDSVNGGRTIDADDLPDGDIIVYSPAWEREERRGQPTIYVDHVAKMFPNSTLLSLATNRWKKFMRENDNVRTLDTVIKDYYKEFQDSLTDYEYAVLQGNSDAFRALGTLDPNRIDDPELKDIIKQVSTARPVSGEWSRIKQVYRVAREEWPPALEDRDTNINDTIDRYPFLRYAGRSDVDTEHVYQYINLMWKDSK